MEQETKNSADRGGCCPPQSKLLTSLIQYDKVRSKFGQQQLVMVHYACRFLSQSKTGNERSLQQDRGLTVLDLKTSCRASVRWTETICRDCCLLQWTSVFSNLTWRSSTRPQAWTRLVATKNRLMCCKLKSRQILTRFDPDKKCSSTTKNRLVCGVFYN